MKHTHFWSPLLLAASLTGPVAFADHPLTCQSADHRYVGVGDPDTMEAKLYIDGKLAPHGDLACAGQEGGEAIDCRSKDVKDAGYHLIVTRPGSHFEAEVREVSFGGEKKISTLECDF